MSGNLYIINVYMPINDSNPKQKSNKHLDILHTLIWKYSPLRTVIPGGDMNGTLVSSRNNLHNISLNDFVREHNLSRCQPDMETAPTFVSHTGNGVSQIDYVFSTF